MFQRIRLAVFIVPILFVIAFPVFDLSGGGCVDWWAKDCNGAGQVGCASMFTADPGWWVADEVFLVNQAATNCNTKLDNTGAPCANFTIYQNVAGGCGVN